jgi:hypothetical protein
MSYYQSKGYQGGHRRDRRKLLAVIYALAAVFLALGLIVAAVNARSEEPSVPARSDGTASPGPSPTASPEAAGLGSVDQAADAGDGDGGGGGGEGPAGPADQGGGPGGGTDSEEPDEPEQPAEPLSIDATIDTVAPGGQCFASGTITVSGGEYPLTVHYQWRALVIAGGLDGDPVSPVHNVNVTQPGEIGVQTNDLPEDGTNVFLVVSGPVDAGSGLVGYDGCADGPGDITAGE